MSTEINRLSELAKEDPKRRFFSIAHLITRKNVRGIPTSTKGCQCRGGRRHLRGVRKGRCEKHPRAASTAQGWQVSGPTAAPSLHPQGKRETEADLDSRPRGQARAEGGGRNTKCHLRAGFSR